MFPKRIEIKGFKNIEGISVPQKYLAETGALIIEGDNGEGKSSFLDALKWVFDGSSNPDLIHRTEELHQKLNQLKQTGGNSKKINEIEQELKEEKAEVTIKTQDGITIRRYLKRSADQMQLVVHDENGNRVDAAKSFLKQRYDWHHAAFDPSKLLQDDPRVIKNEIGSLFPISVTMECTNDEKDSNEYVCLTNLLNKCNANFVKDEYSDVWGELKADIQAVSGSFMEALSYVVKRLERVRKDLGQKRRHYREVVADKKEALGNIADKTWEHGEIESLIDNYREAVDELPNDSSIRTAITTHYDGLPDVSSFLQFVDKAYEEEGDLFEIETLVNNVQTAINDKKEERAHKRGRKEEIKQTIEDYKAERKKKKEQLDNSVGQYGEYSWQDQSYDKIDETIQQLRKKKNRLDDKIKQYRDKKEQLNRANTSIIVDKVGPNLYTLTVKENKLSNKLNGYKGQVAKFKKKEKEKKSKVNTLMEQISDFDYQEIINYINNPNEVDLDRIESSLSIIKDLKEAYNSLDNIKNKLNEYKSIVKKIQKKINATKKKITTANKQYNQLIDQHKERYRQAISNIITSHTDSVLDKYIANYKKILKKTEKELQAALQYRDNLRLRNRISDITDEIENKKEAKQTIMNYPFEEKEQEIKQLEELNALLKQINDFYEAEAASWEAEKDLKDAKEKYNSVDKKWEGVQSVIIEARETIPADAFNSELNPFYEADKRPALNYDPDRQVVLYKNDEIQANLSKSQKMELALDIVEELNSNFNTILLDEAESIADIKRLANELKANDKLVIMTDVQRRPTGRDRTLWMQNGRLYEEIQSDGTVEDLKMLPRPGNKKEE